MGVNWSTSNDFGWNTWFQISSHVKFDLRHSIVALLELDLRFDNNMLWEHMVNIIA